MINEQSCLDAAAAIEGVAQELEGRGLSASAEILRHALDVLLDVDPDAPLPAADDATRATVAHAYARFTEAVAPGGTSETPIRGPFS